jgi:ATP-dependent DNA helicase RecG
LIEGDVFRIVVKVPEFSTTGEVTGEATPKEGTKPGLVRAHDEAHDGAQVTPQVTPQVQAVPRESEKAASSAQLQKAVGLKDHVHFLKNYLEPLLRAEWIERTISDSPRSPKQKYRLTEKGRRVLKGIEGDSE